MNWHYSKDGEKRGPFSMDELLVMLKDGTITYTDLAWNKEMETWRPIQEIESLISSPSNIGGQPPPIPSEISPTRTGPTQTLSHVASSYLWQSILITLFCWPLGIVCLLKASKVRSLTKSGHRSEALIASKNAKIWCWIGSIIASIIFLLLVLDTLVIELSARGYISR